MGVSQTITSTNQSINPPRQNPAPIYNRSMQFISPQNDFAFKRIFGNEQHKEVLIRKPLINSTYTACAA